MNYAPNEENVENIPAPVITQFAPHNSNVKNSMTNANKAWQPNTKAIATHYSINGEIRSVGATVRWRNEPPTKLQ